MHEALRLPPFSGGREYVLVPFDCCHGGDSSVVVVFASEGISVVLLRQHSRGRTPPDIRSRLSVEFCAGSIYF